MPLGIGGSGLLGIAFETTRGTYEAPTKWVPIRSESLTMNEEPQYLTPIRGLADRSGFKLGYFTVEGDIEMEVTADLLPYFLYAARMTPVKTDTAGVAPFTYTFTPANVVLPTTDPIDDAARKTLSIYVERAEEPFAYLGMSVGSVAFGVGDDGNLIVTFSLAGVDVDSTVTQVAPSYSSSWQPFGPGLVGVELPSGSERVDIDTFSFDINDGIESLNRIKTTGGRGPSYVRWGEREVSGSFDHDFLNKSEYDAFVAKTTRSFRFFGERNAASDRVEITANTFLTDSYPVNLGGLGDLVRATVDFHAIHYNGQVPYQIVCKTNEDIS